MIPSVMERNFKVPLEIANKEFNNPNKPFLGNNSSNFQNQQYLTY